MWTRAQLLLSVLAVLSGSGTVAAGRAYHQLHATETAATRQAVQHLQEVQSLQQTYYRRHLTFASSPQALGADEPSRDPWRYQVTTGWLNDDAVALVEAERGGERLAIDVSGALYHSRLRPLPHIPPWTPGTRLSRR